VAPASWAARYTPSTVSSHPRRILLLLLLTS
jgi:hypothetical protein